MHFDDHQHFVQNARMCIRSIRKRCKKKVAQVPRFKFSVFFFNKCFYFSQLSQLLAHDLFLLHQSFGLVSVVKSPHPIIPWSSLTPLPPHIPSCLSSVSLHSSSATSFTCITYSSLNYQLLLLFPFLELYHINLHVCLSPEFHSYRIYIKPIMHLSLLLNY